MREKMENGDYITSSIIKGLGQKQNSEILHSYTVAKATETINWDNIAVDEDLGYKKALISVTVHCG